MTHQGDRLIIESGSLKVWMTDTNTWFLTENGHFLESGFADTPEQGQRQAACAVARHQRQNFEQFHL